MIDLVGASFGTAALLQHLDGVLTSIQRLAGEQPPDSKTTEFAEQIKDFVAITSSLDDTTTSRRRQPFHSQALSEGDIIQLQRLSSSVTTIVQECTESIDILQSALLDLIREKDSNPYFPAKVSLGNQDWYEEWLHIMRLQTEALQVLLSATNLLYQKNDLDEDGHMPSETRSLASTLQYQIAHLSQKLQTVDPQHRKWVSSFFFMYPSQLI
jgi:hypothetical protein